MLKAIDDVIARRVKSGSNFLLRRDQVEVNDSREAMTDDICSPEDVDHRYEEISILTKLCEDRRVLIVEADEKIRVLNESFRNQEYEASKIRNELSDCYRHIGAEKAKVSGLKIDIERISAELASEKKRSQGVEKKIRSELSECHKVIGDERAKVSDLKFDMERVSSELDKEKKRLKNIKDEKNCLEQSLADLQGDFSRLSFIQRKSESDMSRINKENDDLRAEIEELNLRLEGVLASNSWRITSPFRYLKITILKFANFPSPLFSTSPQ